MITTADAELLEREEELETLRSLLAGARDGRGGVAFVEAPAGQGKTSLLRAVKAAAGDLRVLSAVGAELERDFAYGLVRQLFEPELRAADPARRARLLAGPAGHGVAVLDGPYEPDLGTDACHVRKHGLVWLAANLADERPLAIVVDDAHWADAGSLRVLGMLARRVEELPIALIVATRPAEQPLVDDIAQAPGAIVLYPQPLSTEAVARVLGSALPGALEPAFATAAADTTAGNPLLVRELRRTLAADGFTGRAGEAEAVRRTVPGTITRMVRTRLAKLPEDSRALARAAAALGEQAGLACVDDLAGLEGERAVAAHAALADANLMERDARRFTHPMMREATLAGVVSGERSLLHRRAAALLVQVGASEDEIAAQLLAAEPAHDSEAARVLASAGSRALAKGDTDVAVDLLRRALDEPPAPAARPELLLSLGVAEARLGLPVADEHLAEAAASSDGAIAARAAQARARVLVMSGRARRAAAVLRAGIESARPEHADLAAELEDDLLDALIYDPALADERRERVLAAAPRPAVLAYRAFDRAAAGAPAAEVRELANRALDGGTLLLGGGIERPAVQYAIEALMTVEAASEARAALEQAAALAQRAGSSAGAGTVALLRTRWEHEYGELGAAQDAALAALDAQAALLSHGPALRVRVALAAAHFDAGDLKEAEGVLEGAYLPENGVPMCGFHTLRARIHLARGRAAAALEDVRTQIALEARRGWVHTFREDTRATLVTALAETGQIDEALAAADAQLALVRARGLHGAEARLLLARARLAIVRDDEIDWLEAAVAAARRSPSSLIQAEALGALGAVLRRAGRRSDAREPLREARELALKVGATGLEARVHQELVVAGARPQRIAQAGVDGLTPSERRVAELAAAGRRNREIAEALFVTLKTVEVHLGRTYAKLGIGSRSQLAAALA